MIFFMYIHKAKSKLKFPCFFTRSRHAHFEVSAGLFPHSKNIFSYLRVKWFNPYSKKYILSDVFHFTANNSIQYSRCYSHLFSTAFF